MIKGQCCAELCGIALIFLTGKELFMNGESERQLTLSDGRVIKYILDCKPRKNMYISIREGKVVLKISPKTPISTAESFLREKSDWILKNLSASKSEHGIPENCKDGSKISVAGRDYTVTAVKSDRYSPPKFSGDRLTVYVRDPSDNEFIRKQCQQATTQRAVEIIRERAELLVEKTGLCPVKITVKSLTASWGRCSSTGNISINVNIAFYPIECIDYVIIHELCHLKHMNHSKSFWELVEKYCPDWKKIRSSIR